MVKVKPDGTSYVTPPAIITCYCALNVDNFPFDEKNCELKWGRLLILKMILIYEKILLVNFFSI